jgi:hypothetical protein
MPKCYNCRVEQPEELEIEECLTCYTQIYFSAGSTKGIYCLEHQQQLGQDIQELENKLSLVKGKIKHWLALLADRTNPRRKTRSRVVKE